MPTRLDTAKRNAEQVSSVHVTRRHRGDAADYYETSMWLPHPDGGEKLFRLAYRASDWKKAVEYAERLAACIGDDVSVERH